MTKPNRTERGNVTSSLTTGYFSLKQANASLVYIRRVVEDMVTQYENVQELRELIETPHGSDYQQAYHAARQSLDRYTAELHKAGVEVRDYNLGRVDFPAWHQDRAIVWSWQIGESQIDYWQEAEPTVGDVRQPISKLHAPKCVSA